MKRRFLTKRLESKCLQCGEFWHDQCSAQQGGDRRGLGPPMGAAVTSLMAQQVRSSQEILDYTLCTDIFALMMMDDTV